MRLAGAETTGGARNQDFSKAMCLEDPGLLSDATEQVEDLRDEVARLTDVVNAQRMEIRRLRRDAVRDVLTGLLNRRGFERVLERSIAFVSRYQSDVALIYADLDNFKSINDTLGHAAGDAALKHVAEVLLQALRRSDVVGRIGGDEFVALLWKSDECAARAVAREVSDALTRAPFVHKGRSVLLSASLGVATLAFEDSAAGVLDRADRDMYRVKSR
ncbi:GGDEF domain-containing protein [Breoghania corrubedonensis]|nr:GGDEF domain-containing protein [Breoghania corrubedonensis]